MHEYIVVVSHMMYGNKLEVVVFETEKSYDLKFLEKVVKKWDRGTGLWVVMSGELSSSRKVLNAGYDVGLRIFERADEFLDNMKEVMNNEEVI